MRTLRSRSHRFAPAAIGTAALLGGFLLLQLGHVSPSSAQESDTQLAVATRGDGGQTASRGSSRTGAVNLLAAPAPAGSQGLLTSSVNLDMATTTTTVPLTTTTTVPPTTTTVKPTTTTKPKPKVRPPVEAKPSGPIGDDVWTRLARCESGMRNDQGAPYYGYFQFSASTWRGVGGAGLPTDHSYEEQLAMAKKLQARSGWGQWPVCGKVALRG